MNRNVLIVMAGGFLVAVLVAMLVQATLKTDRKKQPLKEEARVQIVVASKAIKAGEKLTEANVKWQDWPKSGVFEGLLVKEGNKKITDIAEGKVRRAMAINEPITKSSLVPAKVNYLAASMAPGMRAVAIAGNAGSSAGGFVAPGDFVDVILTYRIRFSVNDRSDPVVHDLLQRNIYRRASETILQNIKVLAVDQAATRNEEKVKAGKVYTLEVTPRQAQTLALASSVGALELSLRGMGDDKIVLPRTPAATDARITRLYGELMDELNEKRGGENAVSSVRVFNGNFSDRVSVSP